MKRAVCFTVVFAMLIAGQLIAGEPNKAPQNVAESTNLIESNAHHSHKKLWITIAVVAGAAIATGFIVEHEESSHRMKPLSQCNIFLEPSHFTKESQWQAANLAACQSAGF